MSKRSWSDHALRISIANSSSWSEVLSKLGIGQWGGNFRIVQKHARLQGLDTSHFKPTYISPNRVILFKKTPLFEILVQNSTYSNTSNLKKRLIRDGLLENQCGECGITEWHGRVLSLHLDHENGDCADNRIQNLRLLCPNCHSLTPTYCGKKLRIPECCVDCGSPVQRRTKRCRPCRMSYAGNTRAGKVGSLTCETCAKKISRKAKMCRGCSALSRQGTKQRIKWPSAHEIRAQVLATSYVAVAKQLGVSDNAVRKYLQKRT